MKDEDYTIGLALEIFCVGIVVFACIVLAMLRMV